MERRRVVMVGALAWAIAGFVVAMLALPDANSDARLIVGLASVLGPAAAVGAARSLNEDSDRLAGALLLVSVGTPTYFAYPLNIAALVVGLVLLIAPYAIVGRPGPSVPRHQTS